MFSYFGKFGVLCFFSENYLKLCETRLGLVNESKEGNTINCSQAIQKNGSCKAFMFSVSCIKCNVYIIV